MDTLDNDAIDEEVDTELEVDTLKVTKSNKKMKTVLKCNSSKQFSANDSAH